MDNAVMRDATDGVQGERCVYIVDDDRDVRRSLHFMLSSSSLKPRAFGLPDDFIDELSHLVPGPILLDLRMEELDGLQVLEILNQRDIRWPVIMLTAHGDVSTAVRAIKLGAMDFIEKPFSPETLNHALDRAYTALEQVAHLWRRRDDARRLFGKLSKREGEVLELLMEGTGNKQMAHHLGISVRTVEGHRRSGLAKMGVKSVAELVTLAATAEIAPAPPIRDDPGRDDRIDLPRSVD